LTAGWQCEAVSRQQDNCQSEGEAESLKERSPVNLFRLTGQNFLGRLGIQGGVGNELRIVTYGRFCNL
jgi:hypothetical protein